MPHGLDRAIGSTHDESAVVIDRHRGELRIDSLDQLDFERRGWMMPEGRALNGRA